nr:glycosyltransferase family 2 protein [uncultured Desulfobacter sp.]
MDSKNTDTPLFSIIIAAYNCENTLETAVNSCLLQNIDLEIIIINDASSDQTLSVAEKFRTTGNVFVFSNKKNCGPGFARNKGIKAARGRWIVQLDGDDWLLPNRLLNLFRIAERYKADCVADDLFLVEDKSRMAFSTRFIENGLFWKHIRKIRPVDLVDFDLGSIKPIIKRELLISKGIKYPEHVFYGEDFLFMLQLILSDAEIYISPIPGYCLRRGDTGSLTTDKNNLYRQLIDMVNLLLKDPEIKETPGLFSALRKRQSHLLRLLKINRSTSKLKRKKYSEVIRYLSTNPSTLFSLIRRLIDVIRIRTNRKIEFRRKMKYFHIVPID